MNRNLIVALGLLATVACTKDAPESSVIRTEPVRYRSIVVSAEATGVASRQCGRGEVEGVGQINRMTVETRARCFQGDSWCSQTPATSISVGAGEARPTTPRVADDVALETPVVSASCYRSASSR